MGPLEGVTVVEIASLGPGPWAAMVLSDLGADVIRVDRADEVGRPGPPIDAATRRGRRSVAVDLRAAEGPEVVLRLAERADALIEGGRPGVAERLGIGPDVCLERNPRLVYGRMTGWGQEGPMARTAGHDINYLAMTGLLHAIGPAGGPPTVPLNLVGDFGGGGMLLLVGIVSGLLEASRSGRGQVVDAAMVDGASLLGTSVLGRLQTGQWADRREANLLDGGAPFYTTYETADGRFIAVGALEAPFYARLLEGLGLSPDELPDRSDRSSWPQLRERFAAVVRTRTRADWARAFEGSEACVTPVLTLGEALDHPAAAARDAFVSVDGVRQPAPAPRFSRTPGAVRSGRAAAGEHTDELLREHGFTDAEIVRLGECGAVRRSG